MIKSDIATIIGILKTAYPQYYRDKETIVDIINLWYELFQNDDINLIKIAVKTYISNNTSGFPPTIGQIKEEVYKLTHKEEVPTDLWNELLEACRDGIYHSVEVFETLSEPVKKFLKSPAQLKELSMIDSDTLNTVTKGQFLKQIEVIQQREKEEKTMLPERRNFLNKLADNLNVNKLLGG